MRRKRTSSWRAVKASARVCKHPRFSAGASTILYYRPARRSTSDIYSTRAARVCCDIPMCSVSHALGRLQAALEREEHSSQHALARAAACATNEYAMHARRKRAGIAGARSRLPRESVQSQAPAWDCCSRRTRWTSCARTRATRAALRRRVKLRRDRAATSSTAVRTLPADSTSSTSNERRTSCRAAARQLARRLRTTRELRARCARNSSSAFSRAASLVLQDQGRVRRTQAHARIRARVRCYSRAASRVHARCVVAASPCARVRAHTVPPLSAASAAMTDMLVRTQRDKLRACRAQLARRPQTSREVARVRAQLHLAARSTYLLVSAASRT